MATNCSKCDALQSEVAKLKKENSILRNELWHYQELVRIVTGHVRTHFNSAAGRIAGGHISAKEMSRHRGIVDVLNPLCTMLDIPAQRPALPLKVHLRRLKGLTPWGK